MKGVSKKRKTTRVGISKCPKKRKTTRVGISKRPTNLCPPITLKEIKASPYVYKFSRSRIDN
jgi:hypothetical protein